MTPLDTYVPRTDGPGRVLTGPAEETRSAVRGGDPGAVGVTVCSFYTDDEYYRGHAETLRRNCERLGIELTLEEVHKEEGEDWADICRRKIGFLARVCEEHPDRLVFWIDVDCSLLSLPDYVRSTTADLIGFQRGFGSALTIGYAQRTRFWEPCFFGINTSPAARRFIRDARDLEQTLSVKATDDYFFEESWRKNAASMSFQVIPSSAVLSRATTDSGVVPFFSFGSSGKVAEFKDKVAQHGALAGAAPATRVGLRRRALRAAKRIEAALPTGASRHLRRVADEVGVTHVLTRGGEVGSRAGGLSVPGGGGAAPARSQHRARITRQMLTASQRGDVEAVEASFARLDVTGATAPEIATKAAADSFVHYVRRSPEQDPLPLIWWSRPFPGNFGDWLSPWVFGALSGRSIAYQSPTAPSADPHLIGVGSIGRFIKTHSIVVGTGISSEDLELDPRATYLSVRGPVTASVVRRSGGPEVQSFGDPGVLVRRLFPVERDETNGRIALVRHFKHANVPLQLPEHMDELSVLLSHPEQIGHFLATLNRYDAVVTSAMHVMIACHSYGIPCTLVGFLGLEAAVHGTGIKYGDYTRGVGLDPVHEPQIVGLDLRTVPWESMLTVERIPDAKLDEVEAAVRAGVSTYLGATG